MGGKTKTVSGAPRSARPSAGESTPPFCLLAIKAIPNAPRSEVIGWLGPALKVKVHAPPVEGKANDALCAFLAAALDLPQRAVTVERGDTSRQKVVRINGLNLGDVTQRLGVPPAGK